MEINITVLNYIMVVSLILLLITIIENYFLFKRFNISGWKSLIPIYNNWLTFEMIDLPGWLIFIPVANMIGMLMWPFKIAKKANKSGLLGLLFLFLPHIFLLIIITSKNKTAENNQTESKEISQVLETKTETLELEPIEKIPEFIEQPSLNTDETIVDNITPTNNSYINLEPGELPKQNVDEDITSAFNIKPIMEYENKAVDPIEEVSNTKPINLENIHGPVIPEIDNTEILELTSEKVLDQDILEETIELPKMANDEINSGLTATKTCLNCGFENTYSSKNCYMCGEELQ